MSRCISNHAIKSLNNCICHTLTNLIYAKPVKYVGRREHYDEQVEKQLECQRHGNKKCWRVTLFHTFPSFNTEVFFLTKIFASARVALLFMVTK